MLSCFPETIFGGLSRLRVLRIGNFSEELDSFPYLNSIQDLSSLESLTINGGWRSRIKYLPDQFQRLTALNSLSIWHFKGVEALPEWLGDLASLQTLKLQFCMNLKYLPTATAMQRLSKLRKLEIRDCPFLVKIVPRGVALSGPRFLISQTYKYFGWLAPLLLWPFWSEVLAVLGRVLWGMPVGMG
ncbi:hypothetical protein GH714_013935 [Hevea brasiliensis]|uniref:Disease resistance R13L4/SHOC-2-like LRR domain-containing protein n=1 Tax=Hevea brasiliensis TaxID=3981 RepID=A0A6A6N1J2_HEVBR|nr:hypothetical protein GH714_013935 [Hevea brasiliensis]